MIPPPGDQSPSAIGQIAIMVHDVERATAFYRDVLGLRFLFAAPPGLAFFECGGIRLMLTRPEKTVAGGDAGVIYYRVSDLESSCASLTARGATVRSAPHLIARMPDHQLWMAFILDSEGNTIGLMEERPLT